MGGDVNLSLLVMDIGGSSVKFAIWEKEQLVDKGSFVTPKSWEELKQEMLQLKKGWRRNTQLMALHSVLQVQ